MSPGVLVVERTTLPPNRLRQGDRLRPWLIGVGVASAMASPGVEAHAEPARLFRLPVASIDVALVRFGVQAGVSVGGDPASGCQGFSRPVLGLMSPREALRRLLPAGCDFTQVDAKAFRISKASVAPRPPPTAVKIAMVDVEEITVTAEKRLEPLRGSPFAVTAITGEEADRLGVKSFAELAAQAPSVAETNLGPGRNKLFIRGLSDGAFTGRTQSTVGLYLDDVPISYNAPDPDLRLTDLERIEVLRGPQGTLYGSGSIGGIVRFVTAAPDPHAYAASVEVEAVMNQHADRSAGAEAMVNLPLPGGRAAVRLTAYSDGTAGYLDNPLLGLEDVNRSRRRGGRVSGLIDLSGGWQLRGGYVRQDIFTADSQYTQGAGGLSRDTQVREPHDNDFSQINGGLIHRGAAADVRISAAFIDHDLGTRYDASGAFDLAPGQRAAFDERQRVELWVAEAVVTSTRAGRLRWLVGAFGSKAKENSSGQLDATPSGGGVRMAFAREDELTEAALFGEAAFDLTPRLTATVGARAFATHVVTEAGDFALAAAPLAGLHARLTDHGFAPKVRLSYAFAPDLVFYAQAQEGYRAGGFNLPAAADGMAGGPSVASFRPDRLRSYEAGGEATLLDGALTLRAAAFKAIWRNVQTDQFRPSGLPLTLNIGDGSNIGLEMEAAWRPDRHWRIQLNGLINGPELTRASDVFPAKIDIGLPGVAQRTGAVSVAYRFDLAGLTAEVTGQAAYVGRSFLTFDGATASKMGDYAQARIGLELSDERWRLQAYVANLTDERGDTFAFGNPFSRDRTSQATPLPPRTYGLALRRRF